AVPVGAALRRERAAKQPQDLATNEFLSGNLDTMLDHERGFQGLRDVALEYAFVLGELGIA
ncbi:hypothetical protein ACIPW4_25975, partial [Pseudomonas sp. NPDC089996]|uniref:hypothetical protein n=1 Tax=Pseudomonas sp. NPDC089996 TaxID=3364474 RepID=UPI0038196F37